MLALVQNRKFALSFFYFCSAVFCSVMIGGCTVPTTVIFLNSTNHDVLVFYTGDGHNRTSTAIKPNSVAEIKSLLDMRFSIQSNGSTMDYVPNLPSSVPESLIANVGFGPFFKRIVKAQLGADKCVYLLKNSQETLNRQLDPQPPGFPLCPAKATEKD